MENTFERHERKAIIDSSLLPEVEKRILKNFYPDEHNINGKPYEIGSIYFDNENADIIRHSVSKPYFKEKLRLRTYGTPTQEDYVFFEIKKKINKVGSKRRAILPLCEINKFLDTHIIPDATSCDYINRQVLSEIKYFIEANNVSPYVYIGCLRNAYRSIENPNLRITIDRDIRTRRTELGLEYGRFGNLLLPEEKILLEIKFPEAVPLYLANTLDELGIQLHGFSKAGEEFKQNLLSKKENSQTTILTNERQLL